MSPVDPGRRSFLKASAAAALLASGGCSRPAEPIVPYSRMPESTLPGQSQFFATAMPIGPDAEGLLVESSTGRPIKAEGNPQHPSSLGGTSVQGQASILGLWDPDRSQAPMRRGVAATHGQFLRDVQEFLTRLAASGGNGMHLLLRHSGSPTLQRQLGALLERYPRARTHRWDPLHRDRSVEGARLAFGQPLVPLYALDRARTVLSLDCDFLGDAPGRLRYARQLAARRKPDAMSRLYVMESAPSLAGAMADWRRSLTVQEIEQALLKIEPAIWSDLKMNNGMIIAGESLSPWAHARVHALNHELGAPITLVPPPEGAYESVSALVEAMTAGTVQLLLMLEGNPVYDAPAEIEFGKALARVPLSVHLSGYFDETSALATWHLPATHFLEHWSDVRGFDGTASIVQPLIAPLYAGMSPHELLALLTGGTESGYELVRARWNLRDEEWKAALRTGYLPASAPSPVNAVPRQVAPSPRHAPGWNVRFVPDENVRDGAFANNAWLQELPRPHSKLTWDNAAYLSPASARELGVGNGGRLEISLSGRSLEAPAWILPGHAEKSVTLPLGYGRRHAGRVGDGVGFDAYPIRTSDTPWHATGAVVRKIEGTHAFASTQHHARMEGRDLARHVTLPEIGNFSSKSPDTSLYPDNRYDGYRWAMAIDLNACIGCNACVVACQAENNIPCVGKEQVIAGRELHWIRVDRYYEEAGATRTLFQPVPCMHCEKAPCEEVCPVGATVHDSEGLNLQVYNRCVGTRFCSQNCPYKVRRFNFLQYSDQTQESLKAARNPEVTVRARGVMEKCTYCIQRVVRARIDADKSGRRIVDSEVVTACQGACPTGAIVFGDLNDPGSAVTAAKRSPLHYALLSELNTRPRTTYLARVSNPNPEL